MLYEYLSKDLHVTIIVQILTVLWFVLFYLNHIVHIFLLFLLYDWYIPCGYVVLWNIKRVKFSGYSARVPLQIFFLCYLDVHLCKVFCYHWRLAISNVPTVVCWHCWCIYFNWLNYFLYDVIHSMYVFDKWTISLSDPCDLYEHISYIAYTCVVWVVIYSSKVNMLFFLFKDKLHIIYFWYHLIKIV